MLKHKTLLPILLLALTLSACNETSDATVSGTAVLEGVYTSVAMTLSAQAAQSTATPTIKPSSSPTPIVTATLIPTTTPVQSVNTGVVAISNTGSTCDNSAYVSDVTIADGTVFAPGEAFTKTWKLSNTGTCTWTTSYSIIHYSGNAMSGSTTALSSSVSPGGTIEVSVSMVAPTSTGTYTGYWRLENASGSSFGESVYVQIVVSSSASTVTPTPTSTSEDDQTSTPTSTTAASTSTPTTAATSTTAPTATTAPTNTSVPTAVPTNTPEPTAVPTETPAS